MLVDGVRVADPSSPSGGFDFGNLLTGTSSKFDILRGSNSTIFGSDALGGSVEPEINMITQELKSVEQDFESSIKEAEEQIKGATDEVTEPGGSRPV